MSRPEAGGTAELLGDRPINDVLSPLQLQFAFAASRHMMSVAGARPAEGTSVIPNAAGTAYTVSGRFVGQAEHGSALAIVNRDSLMFLGPLDELLRSTGIYAFVTQNGLGMGGPVGKHMPLPVKGPYQFGQLLARRLGGPGNVAQNLAPEVKTSTHGLTRDWEARVASVVRTGLPDEGVHQQNVSVMKFPIYRGDNSVPEKFLLSVFGERGYRMPPIFVLNK